MCHPTVYTCVVVFDPLLDVQNYSMWKFSNLYPLIWKEKMMKIVWSLICIQYFGSINKMNLKTNAAFLKWFPLTQCITFNTGRERGVFCYRYLLIVFLFFFILRFLPRWGRGGWVCPSRVWRGSWRGSRGGAEGDVPAAVPALVRLVVPATVLWLYNSLYLWKLMEMYLR